VIQFEVTGHQVIPHLPLVPAPHSTQARADSEHADDNHDDAD
jgi:hypothetical protein